MDELLEESYIIKAADFYCIDNKEELKKDLLTIKNNASLKNLVQDFYQLLYVDKSDQYKSIKKFDQELNQKTFLNKIILLLGYQTHLENMTKRKFTSFQRQYQNMILHHILQKDVVSFDDLQWATRFIRGILIQVGPLQYEIMNEIPYYLEEYGDKQIIKIHIPQAQHLYDFLVCDSLEKVDNMIEEYYPEMNTNNVVYYTESWLLSPELSNLLPEKSNILLFQSHFTLIAQKLDQGDFEKYVFENKIRKNTSLQVKLQKYIEHNQELHIGIGILNHYQKKNHRI